MNLSWFSMDMLAFCVEEGNALGTLLLLEVLSLGFV